MDLCSWRCIKEGSVTTDVAEQLPSKHGVEDSLSTPTHAENTIRRQMLMVIVLPESGKNDLIGDNEWSNKK